MTADLEPRPGATAPDVLAALARRSEKEIFFTQVKTGPTQTDDAHLLVIDAIGINPSWVRPHITGYEVKVNRSDWLRDRKWTEYLQFCHYFYLVAPARVIEEPEIPEGVGLMLYSPKTRGLKYQRKAAFRDIGPPDWMILWYILLSRTDQERYPFASSRREYFEAYIRNKHDSQVLAGMVAKKLGEEIGELRSEIKRLQSEAEVGREVAKVCKDFDIHISPWGYGELRRRLARGSPVLPPEVVDFAAHLVSDAEGFKRQVAFLRERGQTTDGPDKD